MWNKHPQHLHGLLHVVDPLHITPSCTNSCADGDLSCRNIHCSCSEGDWAGFWVVWLDDFRGLFQPQWFYDSFGIPQWVWDIYSFCLLGVVCMIPAQVSSCPGSRAQANCSAAALCSHQPSESCWEDKASQGLSQFGASAWSKCKSVHRNTIGRVRL